jgi:hypothetical protein
LAAPAVELASMIAANCVGLQARKNTQQKDRDT